MRKISECLSPQLAKICLHSFQLSKLGEAVSDFLPEHLRSHVSAASFQKGQLLLCVSDGAWATELRFMLPSLRDYLRKEHQLYQLTGIKIKVSHSPVDAHRSKPKRTSRMSADAKNAISDYAEGMQDGALKDALKHLGAGKP